MMLAIKLLLGGALKRLLSAFGALWQWATKKPALALCGLLAVLCAWFWHSRNEARADAAIQRAGWVAEVRLRKADHDAYRAAQVEAERLARAQIRHTQAKYAQAAKDADHANAEIDRLQSAADRFAGMRRQGSAACRVASSPTGTGEGGPAPDRDGPGADAILLTKPEYDQFVANSLRLERVRQWGEALVKDGLAVPAVGF